MSRAETLLSACQLSVGGWHHNDQQLPPSKKSKKRSSRAPQNSTIMHISGKL